MCTWNMLNSLVQSQRLVKFPFQWNNRVSVLKKSGVKCLCHVNILAFKVNNNDMKVRIAR